MGASLKEGYRETLRVHYAGGSGVVVNAALRQRFTEGELSRHTDRMLEQVGRACEGSSVTRARVPV